MISKRIWIIHITLQKKQMLRKIMQIRFRLAFPMGRDSETFRDNGTEIPSLSQDKGTTGQAKNLAKGRAGTAKNRDGMRDKTGQSRKGRCKTENDVLKQKTTF